MAIAWAPPNFEREGVVAGFTLSAGEGLTPAITRGVLFAGGNMYRPEAAPALPAAPANAQSWLFYADGTGFYWANSRDGGRYGDAFVGWVVTTDSAVIAWSGQAVSVEEGAVATEVVPLGELLEHDNEAPPIIAPPLPKSVVISEKPGSRVLDPSNQLPYCTIQVALTTDPPLPDGAWLNYWHSTDGGVGYGFIDKIAASGAAVTFEFTHLVPYPTAQTWKVKVTTGVPGYEYPPDQAVESNALTVDTVGPPANNLCYNIAISNVTYQKLDSGQYQYSFQIDYDTKVDPNFWLSEGSVQGVTVAGVPCPEDPSFAQERFGIIQNYGTEQPGQHRTVSVGSWWVPPAEWTGRTARLRIYVQNRNGVRTAQLWPDGKDYHDLTPDVKYWLGGNYPNIPAPDVVQFDAGTQRADGTFVRAPHWDTLNEKMIFDWAAYLPHDISNLGFVQPFFRINGGDWQEGLIYNGKLYEDGLLRDAIAITGDACPKQGDVVTIVLNSANKLGIHNQSSPGVPSGPSVAITVGAPDKGITVPNLNSGLLGAPLAVVQNQITVADKGISTRYLADQAVTAAQMAQNAVTAANGALAALAVLDSNVDSVHIGKVIAGTVIFTSDVFLARGYNYPLVQLSYDGIYLWSAATTSGISKWETASASGLVGAPHVVISSSSIGLFYGDSTKPAATLSSSAITFWLKSNDSTQPYAQLSSAGLVVYAGSFTSTVSAARITLSYNGGASATLDSLQLKILNGTYSTIVKSTGIELWSVDGNSSSANAILTSSQLKILSGTYSAIFKSTGIELWSVDGNTSSPYVTLTSTQFKIKSGSRSVIVTSDYLQLWSVDGNASSPCVGLDATALMLTSGANQIKLTSTNFGIGVVNGNTFYPKLVASSNGIVVQNGSTLLSATVDGIQMKYGGSPSCMVTVDSNGLIAAVGTDYSQVNAFGITTTGTLNFLGTAFTSAGSVAGGSASAMPSQPVFYLMVVINGSTVKIPCFGVATGGDSIPDPPPEEITPPTDPKLPPDLEYQT
jgi:hypothetical protein